MHHLDCDTLGLRLVIGDGAANKLLRNSVIDSPVVLASLLYRMGRSLDFVAGVALSNEFFLRYAFDDAAKRCVLFGGGYFGMSYDSFPFSNTNVGKAALSEDVLQSAFVTDQAVRNPARLAHGEVQATFRQWRHGQHRT